MELLADRQTCQSKGRKKGVYLLARSLTGSSGMVLSFSMTFSVKLSTKVSQSFFDVR